MSMAASLSWWAGGLYPHRLTPSYLLCCMPQTAAEPGTGAEGRTVTSAYSRRKDVGVAATLSNVLEHACSVTT